MVSRQVSLFSSRLYPSGAHAFLTEDPHDTKPQSSGTDRCVPADIAIPILSCHATVDCVPYLNFRPVSELRPELAPLTSEPPTLLPAPPRAIPRRWRSLPLQSPPLPAPSRTSSRTSPTAAPHSSALSPSVSDTGAAPLSVSLARFSCVLDLTRRHLNPLGFVAPADVDDFFGYCDPGKIGSDLRCSILMGSPCCHSV